MSQSDDLPLHDFPDRIIGRLQAIPAHLRELVQAVAPQIADRLDFEKAQPLQNKMQLPDWRRLESDLLLEIPFEDPTEVKTALICLLVENQMKADPAMPLRTLLYAVFYWERQWRAWESEHARNQPLRLNPVLPIVLHTGEKPWQTNRSLADLFAAPEAMKPYQPTWEPLFWDLATFGVEDLMKLPGFWLPSLATIRVERQSQEDFGAVFSEVLRHLEPLSQEQHARWRQLMEFVILWSLRRRPDEEYDQLLHRGLQGFHEGTLRQEVREMAEVLGKSRLEKAFERGELNASRKHLRRLLEDRFGTLPDVLLQRIDSESDLEKLEAAIVKVWRIQGLSELEI